jgi:hypothetical protein
MTNTMIATENCYVCGAMVPQARVLIDIPTAAELTRASRSSVERWVRAGVVECGPGPRGQVRIYLDSLFHDPLYRELDLRRKRRAR